MDPIGLLAALTALALGLVTVGWVVAHSRRRQPVRVRARTTNGRFSTGSSTGVEK
jgi:hypothetical protein